MELITACNKICKWYKRNRSTNGPNKWWEMTFEGIFWCRLCWRQQHKNQCYRIHSFISRVFHYVGGQRVKEESHCRQQKPSRLLAVRWWKKLCSSEKCQNFLLVPNILDCLFKQCPPLINLQINLPRGFAERSLKVQESSLWDGEFSDTWSFSFHIYNWSVVCSREGELRNAFKIRRWEPSVGENIGVRFRLGNADVTTVKWFFCNEAVWKVGARFLWNRTLPLDVYPL